TVVHGATIIRESADLCMQRLATENPPPGLADELVETLLRPFADNLVVTPKEADALVPLAARIIAAGITRALHPAADEQHFAQYMQIGC
ncbi:MAG: GPR endopeptidase, partial [Firmicutes bacterium]|nr:GPR endopeptidase [Bacillota bacterium]